jgi:hypothetical protein
MKNPENEPLLASVIPFILFILSSLPVLARGSSIASLVLRRAIDVADVEHRRCVERCGVE